MLLIINPVIEPAFNLALEEYLLTSLRREMIMLWRNRSSVIVGRNQNALEEINLDYVTQNDIPVIRRLSGGGAVFHDLGNINFTLISRMKDGDFSNYDKFTAPILDFLRTLGINASLQGRNDLTIQGMKFSGNAQAAKNGMILHHGTLLFDANVSHLADALRSKSAKLESNGVKSVRSRITNIAPYLSETMQASEFLKQLSVYFRTHVPSLAEYTPTDQDLATVHRLVAEKYSRWEWNFGESPAYDYAKSIRFALGSVDLRLSVSGGVIRRVNIFGDFFGLHDISELEQSLCGILHRREAVDSVIKTFCLSDYISGMTSEQFLSLFFS